MIDLAARITPRRLRLVLGYFRGGSHRTLLWRLKCPRCHRWHDLADSQVAGRTAVPCPHCDLTFTRDLTDLVDYRRPQGW